MIPIIIQNGMPFVWSASDWLKIREEHRIIGNLTGCLVGLPRQESFQGLPLMLLKEEVTLLIEKELAYTISDSVLCKLPDETQVNKFKSYKEENTKEQTVCYEEQRKQQVISMIDRIIEGKRRKLMGLNTKKVKPNNSEGNSSNDEHTPPADIVLDREEILKSELNKCSSNVPHSFLVQTFTSDPWVNEEEIEKIEWKFPETDQEKLKYAVFKDLWGKGHYITEGHKFGVDYLVYPGDPVKFHAHLLILCLGYEEGFSAMDLVSYARLGSISRKTFVIASLPPGSDEVQYQSIQWTEDHD